VKYAVQMGLGGMISILSFIKMGSVIQRLMGVGQGIHRHTNNMVTS
jgi:hypothetical protein